MWMWHYSGTVLGLFCQRLLVSCNQFNMTKGVINHPWTSHDWTRISSPLDQHWGLRPFGDILLMIVLCWLRWDWDQNDGNADAFRCVSELVIFSSVFLWCFWMETYLALNQRYPVISMLILLKVPSFLATHHLSACVGSVFRRSCKARRIGDGNFQLSRRESDRQRNLCRSWGFAIPKWPPMVKMSGGSQFMFVLVCWYIAWVCPTSFCDFTTCDHHIRDLCRAGAVVLEAKLEGFAASSRAPSQRASWHTPLHKPVLDIPRTPRASDTGTPCLFEWGRPDSAIGCQESSHWIPLVEWE